MQLADHLRPLLRDHDCVIIPDFGGLVAEAAPARLQPGRQVLSPPTKQVAFNQALTRNDGLLLDALRQHLGVSAHEARELLRQAVARLHQELHDTNRTELPGVGIFRRAAGRGLSFEYTGHDNLLPAAYGLPELAVRPVRLADARPGRAARPQPALRPAAATRRAWLRPVAAAVALVGLLLSANYLPGPQHGYLPLAGLAPRTGDDGARPASAPVAVQPQQATLAQPGWTTRPATLPAEPAAQTPADIATQLPAATPAVEVAAPAPASSAPEEAPATAAVPTSSAPEEAPAAAAVPTSSAPTAPAKLAGVAVRKAVAPKATAVAPLLPKPVVAVAPGAAAPTAKPAAEPAAAAPAFATTIKGRTGRSYIIVGSYARLAQAEDGRQRLARAGYRTRVVLPGAGSRQYRVSAADFADEASAQREAARLRATTRLGKSLWVLTN